MCNFNLIIFLLYLSNYLHELSARRIALEITDTNGDPYTNSTYYYTHEEDAVMTCNLRNNPKKFKLFWTQEHYEGRVVATDTNTNTMSKITIDLSRFDHGDNLLVFCHANEEPAGDGTTNIAAYVQFVKTGTKTPEPNQNQTVASSTASEWDTTLYWSVGAGTLVMMFVVGLVTCACKKSSDKRLVEYELETGVSEVVAAKVAPAQPHLAPTYAAPRDHVLGMTSCTEETNNYVEPFRETDVSLMYSIPVIKSKRIAANQEMERDDEGSYDYVAQTYRVGYANTARSGNDGYVNGF